MASSAIRPLSVPETLEDVTQFTAKLSSSDAANKTVLSKYHVFLSSLRSTPPCDSPFVRCAVPMAVQLYPHQFDDLTAAIHQMINNSLLTCYASDRLEGILLMYHSITIPEKNKIQFNSPVLIVRIVVDCVIFSPKVDSYLVGCVSQRGYDFIGMLLFGIFNVSVTTDNIRAGLAPKLKLQAYAKFKVHANFFNCNPPIVEASMLDKHCKVIKQ